jgi:hypothetical protein
MYKVKTGFEGHSASFCNGHRGPLPWVKQLACETIFVLFVHQCNIHFLFFIIRRHVSASHGHLQVLYFTEADALLCHFFLYASHVLLLIVCLLSVSVYKLYVMFCNAYYMSNCHIYMLLLVISHDCRV